MSKCWYCNEELTTANYCDEHIGICTKCYNSMFKVGNDFVKGLTDKIADLEEKLAESEKEIKEWVAVRDDKNKVINKQTEKINKLKQQLAESEEYSKYNIPKLIEANKSLSKHLAEKDQTIETILKENEELVKNHNVYTWGDEIQQDKIYAITGEALEFLIRNQDKISFAVEQLEVAQKHIQKYVNNFDDMNDCLYAIDNQIKQLKEGKQ